MIHRLTLDLLGRHVGNRAHDDPFLGHRFGRHQAGSFVEVRPTQLGQAEIQDLDPALLIDHHVGRLQITVNNTLVVRHSQGFGQSDGDLEDPGDRHAFGGDQVGKRLALDQLHREEALSICLLDAVQRDDIGMVEGR